MYEPLEDEYEQVKVGDKVTINGANTAYFTDGKEYEVLEVCDDGTAKAVTDGSSSRCYLETSKKYLRKVKENDKTSSEEHPLLNPDSTHYSMIDDVEAITRMEQMYSTEDLMAWSKITAMKYRLRIGNKDEVEKEVVKIRGYEAYYEYLNEKLQRGKDLEDV